MKIETYTIDCTRGLIKTFELAALSAFDREKYAVLFGRQRGRRIEIRDVWYPEDQKKYASRVGTESISGRPQWLCKAMEIAESEGLEIVGDIHSHPWAVKNSRYHQRDRSPSEADFRSSLKLGLTIIGICNISKSPGNTHVSTRLWILQPKVRMHWR